MKFWETITSWLSSMWVFVLTISFPFMTGLNGAEESRNEDLDFEEKNKWKFIKSQIVLLPVMKLFRESNFKSLILLPAGIDCMTYPFTIFNINCACCHIQKFIIALLSWANNESSLEERTWLNSKPQWLFCVLTVLIVKPSEI